MIVLSTPLLQAWNGSVGVPARLDFPFGPDYERACAAGHPAELLEVGPGRGLVVGSQEQISTANWLWQTNHGDLVLVGWYYGGEQSEQHVVDLVCGNQISWQGISTQSFSSYGELMLLHAASSGSELRILDSVDDGYAVIGDGIRRPLATGEYSIGVAEVGGNLDEDSFGCVLCRWVPLGTAA